MLDFCRLLQIHTMCAKPIKLPQYVVFYCALDGPRIRNVYISKTILTSISVEHTHYGHAHLILDRSLSLTRLCIISMHIVSLYVYLAMTTHCVDN